MLFYSYIFSAEEDGQGRVILPQKLRQVAGIKKDIVTLGKGNHLEIWAVEKYNAMLEQLDYDEELKNLGI